MNGRSCCRSSRAATRRGSRSSRTAGGSTPTSSRARWRSTRPTGGIVPEVAARAHLRWIVPVLDEALADGGRDHGRRGRRRGHLRAGARGLAAGRDQLREGARLGARPSRWCPSTTSRATSTPGWLLDPGEAEREAPPFPLVALVVSGGHTFLVEMRDHLDVPLLGGTRRRRGGRGVRQGGPAARPRLSGRAGDLAGGRPRHRARPRLPARVAGRLVRLQLLGAQDRRPADRRARPAPTRGCRPTSATAPCPTPRWPSSPGASRTASSTCSPTKTVRAAEEVGARGIVLGGGVAANAALRSRIAGEAEARGTRDGHAAAGPVHGQRGDDRGRRGATARGRRAGWSRPRRAALAAARPVSGPCASTRGDVQRTLRAAGLHARHNLSQNFLADVDVLEGILREADPGPATRCAGDRARPRVPRPAAFWRRARP